MNVMQPELIWIGKRCYRKNPVLPYYDDTNHSNNVEPLHSKEGKQNLGQFIEANDYDEEEELCEMEVTSMEQLGDGRFRTKMSIASDYLPKIIGRNGDSKRTIERETKTQLNIPKKGQTGDVVITGLNPKDVKSAFIRIRLIISNARKRMPFTHFVSLPLAKQDIKTRFLQFKKDVLEFSRGRIDEDLFQKPEKLHLTIGTLVLLTNDEREKVGLALGECKKRLFNEIIGSAPIEVEIRGIEYMNDDPERVDVLYGRCIDSTGRLQQLADAIVNSLEAEGLLDRQYDKVKLHVTLMNSLFKVKDDSEENTVRSTFNARSILQNWADFSFGHVTIDALHLSQRYSTSKSDGYYLATTKFALIGES